MKRFLIMIMALFALVALSACGKKEYPYDGEFMAFAHGENLEVTMVTVTIKKGKITGYYIDSIQSTRKEIIKEEITTYESKWNEKSKKELGYYYGMHAPQAGTMPVTADNLETYKAYLEEENKLEWFEQAELIEKAWLKDGVDSVTYGKNNVIDNVSGVTVRGDTYVKLAKEAVANAKLGKYQAVVVSGSDLYSAYMLVDKKKIEELVIDTIKELVIDTRQEASKETDEDFAWKEKTKQQLGYYYGMHAPQAGTMPVTAENLETYKAYLEEENKLEWFEQVAIITDDVIKNGKDSKVDKTAGVTIITDNYYQLIAKLFAYKK